MIYKKNILSMIKLEQSHIKSPIIDYIHMDPKQIEKVDDVLVVT